MFDTQKAANALDKTLFCPGAGGSAGCVSRDDALTFIHIEVGYDYTDAKRE
jgi:hypothetical protein